MQALRRGLDPRTRAEASARIADRVVALPRAAAWHDWFIYVSIGSEVDTHGLIHRLLGEGRRVAVPCITGEGHMAAVTITSLDDLRTGPMGVPSPRFDRGRITRPQVCIVPGLAFTPDGKRLGGGGGYYDRWLASHRPPCIVALAFDVQVVEQIPVEPHDVRMKLLVTESRVIKPGDPPRVPGL